MLGLEATRDALAFLARVTDAFSEHDADLQASLDALARAVLPALGDMCCIDVVPPLGEVSFAAAHVDPELEALGVDYGRRWGASPGKPSGPIQRAMQSAMPVVLEQVGPELTAVVAGDPERARLCERFRPSSLYVVPMRLGGRVAGAMSFGFAQGSTRRPDATVLALAEEVGRRIGWAIERARRESLADAERAERVEAVRRSREAYRALVEHSPDVVSRLDRDKRHLYMSRGVEQAIGRSPDDYLGRTFAEAGTEPHLALAWEAIVERVFSSGRPESCVFALPTPGGPREFESRFVPELAADGSVATVIRISRDVTAERAAARAMERANRGLRVLSHGMEEIARAGSEEALLAGVCRTVVEHGGYRLAWVGYADSGPDLPVRIAASAGPAGELIRGFEVSWDESLAKGRGPTGTAVRSGRPAIFRRLSDDARFDPWRGLVEALAFRAAIALPIASEGRTIGALSLYATDDDAFDDDEVALLVRLAEALSLGIDATRAREARDASDAALRAREEHFRGLIENASDAVLVVSEDRRIRYASPALRRILGFEPPQVEGRPLMELLAPDARDRAASVLAAALAMPGLVHTFATVGVHRDGGARELEIVGHRPAGEGAARLVLHARDVTERARLDAHLRETQKMDALNRLAAGIAHDFGNVLTIVQGAAAMLRVRLRGVDLGREEIAEILAAADRAASLTRQLLLFSRKSVEEPKVVDVRATCADVERMLRRLVGVDVRLELRPSELPARARIDPGQLEQVVLNLAVNARDAMPQGGLLSIAAGPLDLDAPLDSVDGPIPPGAYATLAVTDDGVGVEPAVAARIFDPFFTTKPAGRGTGLGLSTVRSIVHRAGGYVRLESRPGAGARFVVLLPRVEAEVARLAAAPHRELRGSGLLLLVDDDEAVRRLGGRALREQGYEVIEAGDGEEALTAFLRARAQVRLVVTDLVMPRVRGQVLAAKLAELDPTLPVLLVSALADELPARELGARRAFLAKPFAPDALLAKVRDLLDLPPDAPSPAAAARA